MLVDDPGDEAACKDKGTGLFVEPQRSGEDAEVDRCFWSVECCENSGEEIPEGCELADDCFCSSVYIIEHM
jgi:hypothetical protein